MSLVAWFPLNGNINNYGTASLTLSYVNSANTNVTLYTGKIGLCYYNNSNSAGALISNETISLGNKQSMCCWVKFSSLESSASLGGAMVGTHRYSTNTGMGLTIRYVSSTTGYLSINTGNGSSRTYNTYYGSTLLQANIWYHVAFTYDGNIAKLYVNGTEDGSFTIGAMSIPEDYVIVGAWSLNGGAGNKAVHENYKLLGYLNDVRIYDHTLSVKEIKEISKALILHYDFEDEEIGSTAKVYDSSGYGYNGTANGSIQVNSTTASGQHSLKFNGSNTYTETIIPGGLNAYTFMLWVCFDAAGSYHLLDVRSSDSYGMQPFYCGLTYGIQFYSSNGESLQPDAATCGWSSSDVGKWFHLTGVIDITGCKIYVNGVLKASNTSTKTGSWGSLPLRLGTRLNGQNWFNGKVADLKIYTTALSETDIKAEYNRKAAIDKNGNLFTGEFVETDNSATKIDKNNFVASNLFATTMTLDDGSIWVPICIHYIPDGLFTGASQTLCYASRNIWTNFGAISDLERPESDQWEFYVMQQSTVGGAFSKYRFKQNVNPMSATWDQVNPNKVGTNVTRISGTSTNNYAGMYWYNASNMAMCFANTSNGNWFGCGARAYWGTGYTPGYNGEQVRGWQLVYMRISKHKARMFENGIIIPTDIIEN